jgi:hypothetical protein
LCTPPCSTPNALSECTMPVVNPCVAMLFVSLRVFD